jgi:hypothetical protein
MAAPNLHSTVAAGRIASLKWTKQKKMRTHETEPVIHGGAACASE